MLASIGEAALAGLAGAMEEQHCPNAHPVFAEGEPGDSMYFIASGRVRIEKRAQTASVRQKTLTVLEAGDYFGEMALLDEKPRSASAVVAGSATLLRLSRAAFDHLQRTSSVAAMSLLFAMIRTSSERIRRLSAQVVVYDEVGKALGEAAGLDDLLHAILEQLSLATSADWGFVVLRSQFSDRLELRSEMNLMLNRQQLETVSNGEGFLGPILRQPENQLVDDFDAQEPFKSCPRLGFESPSMLLSPIQLEGRLLGLIVLGGQERAQFDLDALNLARGVARQAAQAILNARHREEEHARSRHARQFVRF